MAIPELLRGPGAVAVDQERDQIFLFVLLLLLGFVVSAALRRIDTARKSCVVLPIKTCCDCPAAIPENVPAPVTGVAAVQAVSQSKKSRRRKRHAEFRANRKASPVHTEDTLEEFPPEVEAVTSPVAASEESEEDKVEAVVVQVPASDESEEEKVFEEGSDAIADSDEQGVESVAWVDECCGPHACVGATGCGCIGGLDAWGCVEHSFYGRNLLLAHQGISLRIAKGPPGLELPEAARVAAASAPRLRTMAFGHAELRRGWPSPAHCQRS
eukprot:TRINITY_DN1898_c1_g1_i1.p1 TRINITY_DN1898_c1_g1~~TRINITY_DN1898_c1_g1_i1.p1  ORF type:complete len:309 (-),score=45.64 TRINITY_DN1898_c1_g1_i1:48-857(-)